FIQSNSDSNMVYCFCIYHDMALIVLLLMQQAVIFFLFNIIINSNITTIFSLHEDLLC
ncbi:hypothetical protein L9F63_027206, partial [Diploptera punctata]